MIVRAPRPESNFYILDKKISENVSLSWAARGLLVYLLGKPDHWQVSPAALVLATAESAKPTGRDGVYALLGELRDQGYLVQQQQRLANGVMGPSVYFVGETPFAKPPHTAQPDTAQPYPANPTLVSIEKEVRTEKKVSIQTKESANTKKSSIPKILFDAETGLFVGPVGDHFDRWKKAFPATNVEAEVLRAAAWVMANPAKRKAEYLRFLTSWLSRAQDRAGPVAHGEQRHAPRPQSNHDRRAEFATAIFDGLEEAFRH